MKKILTSLSLLALPAFSMAQTISTGQSLSNLQLFLNSLIPIVIGIAVFIFIVGLIRYVNAGGDEDRIKAARNTIVWGLIIIFVMFSAVGLVNLVSHSLNLNNQLDYTNSPKI